MKATAPTLQKPLLSQDPKVWKFGLRIGLFVVLVAVWEVAGRATAGLSMPTFSKTVLAWFDLVSRGELVPAFVTSNVTLFTAFALSFAVAMVLGVLIGRIDWFDRFCSPYLNVTLAMPMVAIMPIIVAMLGLSIEARMVIIFLFSVPIITSNVATGVRTVARELVEMGRSFSATEMQLLRHVVLPGAVPAIVAGLRLGLGRALVGMILAELTILAVGIGTLVLQYKSFQPDRLFAVILTVVLEGVLLMSGMQWIERRLTKWKGGPNEV